MTSPWLHRFALATALATLALIGVGGLVTSHGVGMSVPDWPNTYGYNMFFFPFSKWAGGIFYEHSHRLLASAVGLLTTVLALWFFGRSARPLLRIGGGILLTLGLALGVSQARHRDDAIVLALTGLTAFAAGFVWPRCEPSARWLRRLGVAAFLGVLLQGVLGGLRVVLFKDQIGIFHATLAQLFFVLVCLLALFTSAWWTGLAARLPRSARRSAPGLTSFFAVASALILAQLVLGATMRHQHAGLSIPDFPLAYGRFLPALDPGSIAHYNQQRIEVEAANPITAAQIILQLAHRLLALIILGAVGLAAWRARPLRAQNPVIARGALIWLGLILLQALLGAATIWSNKAADIATLHVVTGALSLVAGTMLTAVTYRMSEATATSPVANPPATELSFGTTPVPAAGLE